MVREEAAVNENEKEEEGEKDVVVVVAVVECGDHIDRVPLKGVAEVVTVTVLVVEVRNEGQPWTEHATDTIDGCRGYCGCWRCACDVDAANSRRDGLRWDYMTDPVHLLVVLYS
jgi:hypothetical protein